MTQHREHMTPNRKHMTQNNQTHNRQKQNKTRIIKKRNKNKQKNKETIQRNNFFFFSQTETSNVDVFPRINYVRHQYIFSFTLYFCQNSYILEGKKYVFL